MGMKVVSRFFFTEFFFSFVFFRVSEEMELVLIVSILGEYRV